MFSAPFEYNLWGRCLFMQGGRASVNVEILEILAEYRLRPKTRLFRRHGR